MNNKIKDALDDFLTSFESVFHYDWDFTAGRLNGDTSDYISPMGTFIRPQINDESNKWGNRGSLLDNYRRLLALVKEHGIDPKKSYEQL